MTGGRTHSLSLTINLHLEPLFLAGSLPLSLSLYIYIYIYLYMYMQKYRILCPTLVNRASVLNIGGDTASKLQGPHKHRSRGAVDHLLAAAGEVEPTI